MDDPRIAVWNTLHDGEITVIGREEPATLVVFVSAPYLRRRLAPLGDSFSLRLRGVRRFEFAVFDALEVTTSLDEIAELRLEILSTDSQAMPVKIATPQGSLTLDFDSLDISLDTGQPIAHEEIARVSEEFWDEWAASHETA